MHQPLAISTAPPVHPSLDFQLLRAEGIRYIEQFSSDIWTDYNVHDPGITILEVLCYALTELAYRTQFPMEDLLAGTTEASPAGQFFSAAEILPNDPVTALDYRKLLIDIDGVRNAWLFKASAQEIEDKEICIQVGATYAALTREILDCLCNWGLQPDQLRQLADALQKEQFTDHLALQTAINEQLTAAGQDPITFPEEESEADQLFEQYACRRQLDFQSETEKIVYNGLYSICLELEEEIAAKDIAQIEEIKAAVRRRMCAQRNLGEDVLCIDIVAEEPVGICAEIDLAADADPEAVLARIYFSISRYFCPSVRFYSLAERCDHFTYFLISESSLLALQEAELPPTLLETLQPIVGREVLGKAAFLQLLQETIGLTSTELYDSLLFQHVERAKDCDEIFKGPMLTNGFIDDAELEAAVLRDRVFKSDIYRLIMAVPGVRTVNTLKLAKCQDGKLPLDKDAWCLSFAPKCKPVLSIDCSQVHLRQGQISCRPDARRTEEKLQLLKVEAQPSFSGRQLDIVPPRGRYRFLDKYISIQHDFPLTYYLGADGLPPSASHERRTQARQLQGYLLLYDQLMTNYLAQLAAVRDLLSVQQSATATSFSQPLLDIPDLKDLLPPAPTDDELPQEEEYYPEFLKKLVESDSRRDQRRSRILDHLLARFGERFSDYAIGMYRQCRTATCQNDNGSLQRSFQEGLLDRKQLLAALPMISRQRALAFNYKAWDEQLNQADVWNTENVAGLKKRVAALLGLRYYSTEDTDDQDCLGPLPSGALDYRRRTLTCRPTYVLQVYEAEEDCFRFRVRERPDSPVLLLGTRKYQRRQNAERAGRAFLGFSAAPDHYEIIADGDGFRLTVNNDRGNRVAESAVMTQAAAEALREQLLNLACPEDCAVEGFHLLEHILLRPKDDGYALLPGYCSPPYSCTDPYSFWVTAIIPNWMRRFRDAQTRHAFEQVLRRETPAHIALHVCWVDTKQMLRFETAYLHWLTTQAQPEPDRDTLRDHTNTLIRVLCDLYCQTSCDRQTEAPCREDEPVVAN